LLKTLFLTVVLQVYSDGFCWCCCRFNFLATRFSPAGRQTRGTHNNCGNGYTPWGTYLTTEENFIGYFARSTTDDALRTPEEIIALKRYGLKAGSSSLWLGNSNWSSRVTRLYDRWNADVKALQQLKITVMDQIHLVGW
jgi:hypothetical protein